jgi:hypothetical protein
MQTYKVMIDWYGLTSSKQYFSYIQDENSSNNIYKAGC